MLHISLLPQFYWRHLVAEDTGKMWSYNWIAMCSAKTQCSILEGAGREQIVRNHNMKDKDEPTFKDT